MAVTLTTRAGKGSALTHVEMDANWNNINAALMEVGAKTVFIQAAAPSGWTQDNTYNDRVLRLVDSGGTGGATGGNWTLSGVVADGHSLSVAELPPHTHNAEFSVSFGVGAYPTAGGLQGVTPVFRATQSTGSGAAHSHTVSNTTWRPSYADAIVCTKD